MTLRNLHPVPPPTEQDLNGIVVVDKPTGLSSAQVLYKVRGITGQRKSGHAGSLDPTATGILILCLGRATKMVERIMHLPKLYRASARLDVTSETFDSDRPLEPVEVRQVPQRDEVERLLATFCGVSPQVPPAVSAIKIGGVPAYRRVRRNEDVRLDPRPVIIYRLELLHYEWPAISFELLCGRGTYVRALIRDFGRRLGTGGCLTSLRRCAVGPFDERFARTLENLWQCDDPVQYQIQQDEAERIIAEAERQVDPA